MGGLWALKWAWQTFFKVGVANFFFSGRGKLFFGSTDLSVMGVSMGVANFFLGHR